MDIAAHAMARKWWESCFGKNSYSVELSLSVNVGKHHWIWFD
jgi:hypothetical protein